MANAMLSAAHGFLWAKGLHIGKLNSASRPVAAMMGKPDVLPFPGAQMHDHCMTVARVPAHKYYTDAELLVSTQMAVERWYSMDGYIITYDVYNYEVEALGARMIYSDNAMPTVDLAHPLISTPADLAALRPLDVTRGRIPMFVEVVRLVTERAPGLLAAGMFCSPWSMMCALMGYPAAVRALRRQPEFARDVLAYEENDVILPFIAAQARACSVKSFTGADAWSAYPILSLPMIREWVLPSAQRMRALGKARGWNVSAASAAGDYCEEDPDKFDKQILFECLDVMNQNPIMNMRMAQALMGRTQDWDPHWLVEYARSRGGRSPLPIIYSINGRFIRDVKPEELAERVRGWIDVMGRDGKFMIGVGNIPADTAPLNVFTAIAAARTYGKYPIAADLSKVPFELPRFPEFDTWLKGQPEEEVIRDAREKR